MAHQPPINSNRYQSHYQTHFHFQLNSNSFPLSNCRNFTSPQIMNHSSTQDHPQKYNPLKHTKKRLTEDQVSLLEASFDINKKLQPEHKLQLSRDLGIPPRQIAIWYQNKRARWKNQSLELDHSALLHRLQITLADKKQLQKEIERLQLQLHRTQTQVHLAQSQSQSQYPLVSSISNEGGSSSNFNGDYVNNNSGPWDVNDAVLQVEQMYAACLMGAVNGSSNYV